MRKAFLVFACFSLILLSAGCETNKTRVAEGGVIGGVLGAAAGGIIGHQSGHGGAGAGIGLAAGALTGALIGSQIDKPGAQTAVSSTQMTMMQVVDLTKQGVHEDEIVDKIKLTNSKFNLTPNDIAALKQQGVTQKVIDAMQGKS